MIRLLVRKKVTGRSGFEFVIGGMTEPHAQCGSIIYIYIVEI